MNRLYQSIAAVGVAAGLLMTPESARADILFGVSVGDSEIIIADTQTAPIALPADRPTRLNLFAVQRGTFEIPGLPGVFAADFRLSEGTDGSEFRGVSLPLVDLAVFDASDDTMRVAGFDFSGPQFAAGFVEDPNTSGPRAGAPDEPDFRFSGVATPDLDDLDTNGLFPVYAAAAFQTNVGGSNDGPIDQNSVALGSILFDPTGVADGEYLIELSNPGGGLDILLGTDLTNGPFVVPDAARFRVNVGAVAVPEPSSLAAVGMIASLTWCRRRRRRTA